MKHFKFRVLIFIICLTFQSLATKYYVNDGSTTGDIYCTAVGAAGNAGTSPSTPKTTIAAIIALGGFANGDEIFIDAGTYNESNISLPAKTFTIYGAGNNLTIFDNSNGGNPFSQNNGNSTILTINDLTITNYTTSSSGYGMVFTQSSGFNLTMNNVIISNCGTVNPGSAGATCPATINTSGPLSISGGGFFCNGGNSGFGCGAININASANVAISNAIFYNNIKAGGTNKHGSAISNGTSTSAATSTVTVSNSYFLNNSIVGTTTSLGGSAIFVNTTSFTITDCVFEGNSMANTSPTGYGGVCNFRGGTIAVSGTLFDSNTSGAVEGTIATTVSGDITISNSKFTGNTATTTVDIYCTGATTPTVNATNCTFGDNESGNLLTRNLGTFTIANSGNPTKSGTFTTTNTTNPTAYTSPTVPSYSGNCTVSLTPTVVTVTATIGNLGPVNYPDLRLAFANINNGTHQGVVTVTINASTTEKTTAVIYASGSTNGSGTSSYTSVSVHPNVSASALAVSGSITGGPTIQIDGADNITIDGRPGGTGSVSQLTIVNSAASAASNRALLIQNDATTNTIKYCTISSDNSSTTNTTAGVIFIGNASSIGNNNNTIDNCNITFNSSATATGIVNYTASNSNSTNTISNCSVYNFNNYGIWCSTGSTGYTIKNNHLYQTSVSTTSTTGTFLIYTTAGTNYDINSNYLGGKEKYCNSSGYFYLNGNGNIYGINFSATGAGTNYIRNNYIKYLKSSSTTAASVAIGIYLNDATSTTLYISKNILGFINSSNSSTGTNHSSSGMTSTGTCSSLVLYVNKNVVTNIENGIAANSSNLYLYGINFVSASATTSAYYYNNYVNLTTAYAGIAYGVQCGAVSTLFNNTIYVYSPSAQTYYRTCIYVDGTKNNTIKNNLLINPSSGAAVGSNYYSSCVYGYSGTSGTQTHTNNYYQLGGTYSTSFNNNGTATSWTGESGGQTNTDVTLDGSGQASPSASRITDLGTDLRAATPAIGEDILGNSRSDASPWIGCFEGASTIFYTKTFTSNTDANTLSNWNSNRDGVSGSTPGAFNTSGYLFIVQPGHKYQASATWTGNSAGYIQIENGGTLDLNAKTLSTWGSIKMEGTGVSAIGSLINSSSSASSCAIPIILNGNSSIFSSGSGGLTLTGGISLSSYDITFDGSYSNTISTSAISGVGNIIKSGSGTLNFSITNANSGSLTINAGTLSLAANQIITANVNLLSGTLAIGANTLTVSGTSTLTSALTISSGTYDANGILDATGGTITFTGAGNLNLGSTVTSLGTFEAGVASGSTVTYDAAAAQNIDDVTYHHLIIAGTSSAKTLTGNTTVNGDFTNSASGSSFNASSFNLTVNGNFTNNATFAAGTSTITFNGSTLQSLSGTTDPNFYNLVMDNSSTGVTLGLNTTISNALTLTAGLLKTLTYTLTLGTTSANATIPSGSSASYIVAYDNSGSIGSVKQYINSNATYNYPIGDLTNFTPLTFTLTANSGLSSAYFSVYTKATAIPKLKTGSLTTYLTRHWSGTPSGMTSPTYTISYKFTNADVVGIAASLLPVKLSGLTNWYAPTGSSFTTDNDQIPTILEGTGSVNTGTNTLTWSGLTTFSLYGGAGNQATVLPIELFSFDVLKSDDKLFVNWRTASEKDVLYFIVQRSQDGINFEDLHQITAVGNSKKLEDYSLIDVKPWVGLSYYRLKEVNINGGFNFSSVRSVYFEANNNDELFQFYPNPCAKTDLKLLLATDLKGEYQIELIDFLGNIVKQVPILFEPFVKSYTINVTDIPSGTYYLKLNKENELIYSKKLISITD